MDVIIWSKTMKDILAKLLEKILANISNGLVDSNDLLVNYLSSKVVDSNDSDFFYKLVEDLKDNHTNIPILNNLNMREVLRILGTEVLRNVSPNIHVLFELNKILNSIDDYSGPFFADGTRFPNEVKALLLINNESKDVVKSNIENLFVGFDYSTKDLSSSFSKYFGDSFDSKFILESFLSELNQIVDVGSKPLSFDYKLSEFLFIKELEQDRSYIIINKENGSLQQVNSTLDFTKNLALKFGTNIPVDYLLNIKKFKPQEYNPLDLTPDDINFIKSGKSPIVFLERTFLSLESKINIEQIHSLLSEKYPNSTFKDAFIDNELSLSSSFLSSVQNNSYRNQLNACFNSLSKSFDFDLSSGFDKKSLDFITVLLKYGPIRSDPLHPSECSLEHLKSKNNTFINSLNPDNSTLLNLVKKITSENLYSACAGAGSGKSFVTKACSVAVSEAVSNEHKIQDIN
jgi:hypothetical protein